MGIEVLAALTLLSWKGGVLVLYHEWMIFFGSLIWLAIVAALFDNFHVVHKFKFGENTEDE